MRSGVAVLVRAMIYVRRDMRYVMHAFPELYVEYRRRKEMILCKWDTGQGWSFGSGLGGPCKDLTLLHRWLRAQVECSV